MARSPPHTRSRDINNKKQPQHDASAGGATGVEAAGAFPTGSAAREGGSMGVDSTMPAPQLGVEVQQAVGSLLARVAAETDAVAGTQAATLQRAVDERLAALSAELVAVKERAAAAERRAAAAEQRAATLEQRLAAAEGAAAAAKQQAAEAAQQHAPLAARTAALEATIEEVKRSMTHMSDTAQEALLAVQNPNAPPLKRLAEQVEALQRTATQQSGGDAEQRECRAQVVVALPHAPTSALLATAKAAAAAAAKSDAGVVVTARVVFGGEPPSANSGAAAASGPSTGAAGAAAGRRARQALVVVTLKDPAAVQAALRHSAGLRHEERFTDVFVRQSLTRTQQSLRRAYMAHSTELRAARAERRPIVWRDGAPHVREPASPGGGFTLRRLPAPEVAERP
jgi:hypothetical protein